MRLTKQINTHMIEPNIEVKMVLTLSLKIRLFKHFVQATEAVYYNLAPSSTPWLYIGGADITPPLTFFQRASMGKFAWSHFHCAELWKYSSCYEAYQMDSLRISASLKNKITAYHQITNNTK